MSKKVRINYREHGNMLSVEIEGQAVEIRLDKFDKEDLLHLARFGLKRAIQNAGAPIKEPQEKARAMIRKAKELAEGKLFSERSRASRAQIEREAQIRAALAMKAAGVPEKVILETFPLSKDDLK